MYELQEHPYRALAAQEGSFRLIRLRPKSYSPQAPSPDVLVYCEVEDHHFHNDNTPYIALSYTWGNPNECKAVRIGETVYGIGRNLEIALAALRNDNDDVLVWADQICINQHNDLEKSDQVQQMRDIYANAHNVVAWLGTGDSDCEFLVRHFREVDQLLESGERDAVFLIYSNDETRKRVKIAVEKFCSQPYWTRLWIIQEFTVAKELTIMCGKEALSYNQLKTVLVLVRNLSREPLQVAEMPEAIVKGQYGLMDAYNTPAFSFVVGIHTIRSRFHSEGPEYQDTLFRVLVTSLVLEVDYNFPQCTDPRDRIFAILGLARDVSSFDAPDYTKSCEEVYTMTAKKILSLGYFDLLAYCQHTRDAGDKALPSWVPDWRLMIKSPSGNCPWLSFFSASGESASEQKVSVLDDNILSLQGIFVDEIQNFGEIFDPNWLTDLDPETTLNYLREVYEFCQQSPKIQQENIETEVGRIAIADRLQPVSDLNKHTAKFGYNSYTQTYGPKASLTADEIRSTNVYENPLLEMAGLYARLMKRLYARRPFITKTGYVGLAPSNVAEGDVVYIILGAVQPYVLRPGAEGRFSLIGECYMHGIMHGELMQDHPEAQRVFVR